MWTEIETTPWDHSDPVAARGHRVMEALHRFETSEASMRERVARALNVTENEVMALRYVIRKEKAGEPVTPTDVAHYLAIKSAAVTIMVDHLERAGHLERRPHPKDRRSLVLVATESSAARVAEIYAGVYDITMGIARSLGEEDAGRIVAFLDAVGTALDGFVPQGEGERSTSRRRDPGPGDGSGHALAS